MNITFIGNCQTITLCFYFQQLMSNNIDCIRWCNYGDEYTPHLYANGHIFDKCKNKTAVDYHEIIHIIKTSDVIIYQNVSLDKSSYCNTDFLRDTSKSDCRLIQIPCMFLDYMNFDVSIQDLIAREIKNNVDIKVSEIYYMYKEKNVDIMLNIHHPKTILFMIVIEKICNLLECDFFTKEQYDFFMSNEDFMGLK